MVGGFNHREKYESQWEGLSHILWKIKKMFETTNQICIYIYILPYITIYYHYITTIIKG